MTIPTQKHIFTADDFRRMGEAGIFREDDRVELIEGEIIEMTPIGSRHAACVNRLNHMLVEQVGERAIVAVQNPVGLGELSQPQPDLALLRARADFYASKHPEPADILLLVEIADTSLSFDRDVKIPLYAGQGIPEVWLIDLESESADCFWHPTQDGYRDRATFRRRQTLGCRALDLIAVTLDDVFGPRA